MDASLGDADTGVEESSGDPQREAGSEPQGEAGVDEDGSVDEPGDPMDSGMQGEAGEPRDDGGAPEDAGDRNADPDASTNGEPDSGHEPDPGLPTDCTDDSDCDDAIACTLDSCVDGQCSRSIDGEACGTGEACDPRNGGCVDTAICGDDSDCEDDDPCTRNETCNTSAARCEWDILDNDGDGHAAEVCGGDDFDDGSGTDYPGAPDICDGLDNDRDGNVDEEPDASASCPAEHGDSVECVEGECELVCGEEYADCDGEYDNGCEAHLPTSREHCGTCGYSCNSCDGGECGPDACINTLDLYGDHSYFEFLRSRNCDTMGTCFSDIVAECTADCPEEDQACMHLCVDELVPDLYLLGDIAIDDLTDGCMDCALELSACQRSCAEASDRTLQQCACEPDCVESFRACANEYLLFECN